MRQAGPRNIADGSHLKGNFCLAALVCVRIPSASGIKPDSPSSQPHIPAFQRPAFAILSSTDTGSPPRRGGERLGSGGGEAPSRPPPPRRPGFQDLGMWVCPNPLKSPSSFEAAAKVRCWLYPRSGVHGGSPSRGSQAQELRGQQPGPREKAVLGCSGLCPFQGWSHERF